MTTDSTLTVETLTESQIQQLYELLQEQWWGWWRTLNDVRTTIANTSLMIGLIDPNSDKLAGYCRVLTDFTFRATVYDAMVAEHMRGQGLGRRPMRTLCEHPKLQSVSLIYLACEPRLVSFYEEFGFQPYAARMEWMMKVHREE